ncbi:MAG: lysylphosphatidylglycerol synthase transmembrane domain-containing protein [Pseudomonadales bacterium]
MTSRGWILLKVLVTLSMMAVLLHYIEFAAVLEALKKVSLAHAGLAMLLIMGTVPVFALRWLRVAQLGDMPMARRRALLVTTKTYFFNQVLPATVGGDAYRTVAMVKDGHALPDAVVCIGVDRFAGIAVLLGLALLAYPFILTAQLPDLAGIQAALVALVLAGILLSVILLPRLYRSIERREWSQRFVRVWQRYSSSGRWLDVFVVAGWSIVGHLLIGLSVWVLAKGLALPFDLTALLFAFPPAYLASMLPASLGGWGVREGVMVSALVLLGGSASDALVLSVTFGLVMLAVGLAAGLVILFDSMRRALRSSVAAATDSL